MSLLRSATPLSRSLAQSSRSVIMSVRGYADKPSGEFSEAYQRGNPSGFAKKEQVRSRNAECCFRGSTELTMHISSRSGSGESVLPTAREGEAQVS